MEFPDELKEIATSVSNECGYAVEKEVLIDEILKELEKWYPTLWDSSFLAESRVRSILLGKEIRVIDAKTAEGFYPAKAVDLNEHGHLIIERDGKRKVLNSGEVSIRF
jgi:BirA family biotin operon repressor/biotin-[acetyl-CoA-carboxylase] ligase